MSTIRFDLPHALVTLTVTDSSDVEIEVWPKQGQSAYVVLPPEVARHVAGAIVRLADEADEADPGKDVVEDEQGAAATDADATDTAPSNVYDLASRRRAWDIKVP